MAWWMRALALLAIGASGCAMQATGRAPRSTGMGRDPSPVDMSEVNLREVEGEVRAVKSNEVLVVGRDGSEVRLETEKDTTVFVDGGVGGLADLREGVPVRASFEEQDGKRVIHWIEVPRPEKPEENTGMQKAGKEVAR